MPITQPVPPMASHQLLVFLLQVGVLLLLAFVLGRLAMRLRMPAIVGELCAGILVGPSVLAQVAPGLSGWLLPHDAVQFHILDATGQVGVLLLVAVTGIHMDLALVRRRGLSAFQVGIAGLVVPLALGVVIGFLLPDSLVPGSIDRTTFALFMGIAMGVSAIPVIAKTLIDLRLLHRNIGQLILCAVTVDDILGWMLLSVVSAMATSGVRTGDILWSVARMLLVIVASIALRPLVAVALRAAGRSSGNGPTVAVVAIFTLLASAATQALGLEAVVGAFAAGIVMSGCGALERGRLAPLETVVLAVLAPIFFATAGLRMDLTALVHPAVLLSGLAILAVAIVGKFVGAYSGARLTRLGHWEALALGAGLNSRGVVEVIIAMAGLRLGVLSPEMYTIIILVAVVTSLMAPPILRSAMSRVEHTAEEELRERAFGAAPPEPDRAPERIPD